MSIFGGAGFAFVFFFLNAMLDFLELVHTVLSSDPSGDRVVLTLWD